MKVVFVHPSYPNQFTEIAYGLARQAGWECSFLVDEGFTGQIRGDNPPIAYYGYREEALPGSGLYYLQSMEEGARRGKAVVEALAHIKAQRGVDAVVGHASFGTTFFVREVLKIPVVSYIELPGYYPLYCRPEFPGQYPQLLIDISFRALVYSSVLNSDLCLVPSQHAKNLLPKELQNKVRVQVEGFVLPALQDKSCLRQSIGLDAAKPVIGFAARTLEAVRGFDIFVQAAGKIKQARKDVQFLVIGDEKTVYGNEMTYLGDKSFKEYALAAAGLCEQDFVFKPFMPYDRFVNHLQSMDIAMFPLFEGAANWGLFEAMGAGLTILASNRCFVPEVIDHGREGLLFDPGDVEGFSTAALAILDDPESFENLGQNARGKIANRFSLEKAVTGYKKIICEAVGVNL